MRRALIATIALAACTKGPSVPQNTALDRNTHDPKFPIATGVHANADCNDCHGAFSTFTEFSCTAASCHPQSKTDPAHSGLAGYSFDDHACLGLTGPSGRP